MAAMRLVLASIALVACSGSQRPQGDDRVVVPKLWDEAQLATWATPIAGLGMPGHYSEAAYYAAPVDNLRTYPVYHPRFEPAGYRERLIAQGPQPIIDPTHLVTRADWIAAGARVFDELDTAVMRTADPAALAYIRDAAAIDANRDASHDVMTKDGVLLDYRWIVDRDGTLKLTISSCSGCHSRLMPDGTVLRGAPSNFDFADSPASAALLANLYPDKPKRESFYQMYGVPWLADDAHAAIAAKPDEEFDRIVSQDSGAPAGTTFARFNGSPLYTTRMADLIGIEDRRYLDTTGSHLNRGPADIARYGILVEFADNGRFGAHAMVPETVQRLAIRPPDEAMYALALYIYSLEPPPSPFPFDDLARRGKSVFDDLDCASCHPAPSYTNNELVPVPGFTPPNDEATRRLHISKQRVDTDPGLALRTRKGTGYYRVPSLRGLWYRGLYEHSGSLASLEDWFDPRRLRSDYVPTGWRGPGVKTRAIPGHEFGLDLAADDKRALIAFLKTL